MPAAPGISCMTIEEINGLCAGTFVGHLAIEFTGHGPDFVEAKMPVDASKLQPNGILHGGASLALAETVAGCGSLLLVDGEACSVLGLHVAGNHLATISEGLLMARAELVHMGKTIHIWDVNIVSDRGARICIARVTNCILVKKRDEQAAGRS